MIIIFIIINKKLINYAYNSFLKIKFWLKNLFFRKIFEISKQKEWFWIMNEICLFSLSLLFLSTMIKPIAILNDNYKKNSSFSIYTIFLISSNFVFWFDYTKFLFYSYLLIVFLIFLIFCFAFLTIINLKYFSLLIFNCFFIL